MSARLSWKSIASTILLFHYANCAYYLTLDSWKAISTLVHNSIIMYHWNYSAVVSSYWLFLMTSSVHFECNWFSKCLCTGSIFTLFTSCAAFLKLQPYCDQQCTTCDFFSLIMFLANNCQPVTAVIASCRQLKLFNPFSISVLHENSKWELYPHGS